MVRCTACPGAMYIGLLEMLQSHKYTECFLYSFMPLITRTRYLISGGTKSSFDEKMKNIFEVLKTQSDITDNHRQIIERLSEACKCTTYTHTGFRYPFAKTKKSSSGVHRN